MATFAPVCTTYPPHDGQRASKHGEHCDRLAWYHTSPPTARQTANHWQRWQRKSCENCDGYRLPYDGTTEDAERTNKKNVAKAQRLPLGNVPVGHFELYLNSRETEPADPVSRSAYGSANYI